jgi:hypothetical protein
LLLVVILGTKSANDHLRLGVIDDCEDPQLEQHSSLLGHQDNAVSVDKERGYQID